MSYLLAFLFAGIACGIGQIILDNSKFTAGHITTIFTVMGAILSFLGIYPKLLDKFGAGANVIIANFGHLLYSAGIDGYKEEGILGIFNNLLTKSSAAIVAAIVFAFVFVLFFKPKH